MSLPDALAHVALERLAVADQIVVSEANPFRVSRRARRVLDQREIIGPNGHRIAGRPRTFRQVLDVTDR